MSMTLILWKAPVVREAEEAEALLKPFYDSEDESAFEASPDVAAVGEELKRLYPWRRLSNEETVARMSEEERARWKPEALKEMRGYEGGGPWATVPFYQSDRLLVLDIIWSADDAVIDDITRLAREHELVLYDPQGPDVHLPDDPVESGPVPPPSFADQLWIVGMFAMFAALTYAAWLIPIGWIRWPAVAIAAFFTIASLIVVYVVVVAPSEEKE